MAHLLCHNVARRGGDAAQHHQQGHQLFVGKAKAHSQRQEQRRQHHQLDHSSHSGRLEVSQSFLALEACTNGKQGQRAGQTGHIGKGLIQHGRHGNVQHAPRKARCNAQKDGVRQDAFHTLFELFGHIAGLSLRSGRFQHQNDHCHDVIQRHTAKDHQAGHAGIAVDALQKSRAEDGSRRAVTHLNELAHKAGAL